MTALSREMLLAHDTVKGKRTLNSQTNSSNVFLQMKGGITKCTEKAFRSKFDQVRFYDASGDTDQKS